MRSLPTTIVTSVHDRICPDAHDWSGCLRAPWWDIYYKVAKALMDAVEPLAEAKVAADEAHRRLEDVMLDLKTEVGP